MVKFNTVLTMFLAFKLHLQRQIILFLLSLEDHCNFSSITEYICRHVTKFIWIMFLIKRDLFPPLGLAWMTVVLSSVV